MSGDERAESTHEMRQRVSALLDDFTLQRLPATIATGLVFALVNALLTVALMTLIFTGPLDEALSTGIGIGLVATAVIGTTIAVLSGFPGMYSGIQDNSAVILALAAASLSTSLVGPEAVDTVIAMMVTTSLAVGVVFLVMGSFRLGEIARFVPFPVVGGLLAGTGYLILVGSLDVLGAGWSATDLTAAEARGLLWPGLAFGAAYIVASLRHWSPRAYLAILAGSIVAFHVVTQLGGIDQSESLARGWLLGPFPDEGLWPGLAATTLLDANWAEIAGQAASLVTVLFLVPLTLLLYISALEVGTNTDIDVNGELRTSGFANLAAAIFGGPPGFFYLSDTVIARRVVGARRGPALIASLGVFAIALAGGTILELLPQFVIGGLLMFVGVDFIVAWLWSARRRMSRLDYVLMLGIVGVIGAVGFLPGVAAGLAAAIVLFVLRYSRIDVVKHLLTAREHRSNIERPMSHAEYLIEIGDSVLILELHGFIFFGTANQVTDRVKTQLAEIQALRFIIFDFRLVTGVDSSAVALFERLALIARERGIVIIMTGLKAEARDQFAGFLTDYEDVVTHESDLDHGMAWCEDMLLEGLSDDEVAERALPEGLADRLAGYLKPRTIAQGVRLMTQGDPTPGMYLITSGSATVLLENESGHEVRLRTLREGTVLGEIGLYRREPCTATVVADDTCEVLHLAPDAFDDLCRNNSAAAAELHAFVARTLAARVSHANQTIRALRG